MHSHERYLKPFFRGSPVHSSTPEEISRHAAVGS
jgi:hypothetical protein